MQAESRTLDLEDGKQAMVRRLLVVDDSKALRDAVQRLMADLPTWRICGEATNGREAIEKALDLQPDAILMDVLMPELDGLEATRRIRQQLDVAILIFTQYDSGQAAQEATAAGARGYLPKSRAADLVRALEAALEQQNSVGRRFESRNPSGS
ncbi:MAG: response regulator transcription factor [Acidobacteria bacterium]|nr:response regulator transcription factor [Acidobacteriota bacterium]